MTQKDTRELHLVKWGRQPLMYIGCLKSWDASKLCIHTWTSLGMDFQLEQKMSKHRFFQDIQISLQ